MILSLLIPAIPERANQLIGLLNKLDKQLADYYDNHSILGMVEIIVDDSRRFLDGGPSIGAKRDSLVQRAIGKYLCFMDDDDDIAPNYLEQLIRLCNNDPDIVTFRCFFTNDYYWTLLNMSIINKVNEEANPNGIIQRTPWHICPVRAEYAKRETFSDISHNEDWEWISKVMQYVKTEAHTDMILTRYNHSEKDSEADKILQHE